MFRLTALTLACVASLAFSATAFAHDKPVATIVVIKTPPGITRPMLDAVKTFSENVE